MTTEAANKAIRIYIGRPEHYDRELPGLTGPDYVGDLNAMHEAEKAINQPGLLGKYVSRLADVVLGGADQSTFGQQMWRANAAQRAEAFLRTIGKWEES